MSYDAPQSLSAALAALDEGGIVLAGGTDIYPSGMGFARAVDVSQVPEMRGINTGPAGTRIGGAVTWSEIVHADLPAAFDGLQAAARQVGSVQIQNAGTIAGNLCNASPAADGVPPLLTLGAEVELQGPSGARRLPLQAFILGVRKTALSPGEILVALHIPPMPDGAGSAFEKLGSRAHLVISIAMVSALVVCDKKGLIQQAAVAVGACSAVAQRLPALEAALVGQSARDPQIDAAHLAPLSPIDDVRGSAAYRSAAAIELCRRAITGAAR